MSTASGDREVVLPRVGELVVATVDEIGEYGAYVTLDDYGIKGFLPVSEVTSKWTKRIEEVIRPNQKIVVKVLRIDRLTNTVDVSLKEVSPGERRRVFKEWKRNRRGRRLIEEMCEELKLDPGEVMEKLGRIADNYPTLYDMLTDIVVNPGMLKRAGFDRSKVDAMLGFLRKRVHPKKYILEYILEVSYVGGGGVRRVKEALERIDSTLRRNARVEPEITHISAPRYSVKMVSFRPSELKRAKAVMEKCVRDLSGSVTISVKEVKERVEV